jgi:hypothetical protein
LRGRPANPELHLPEGRDEEDGRPMNRALVYVRVASVAQVNGFSLDVQ